MSFQRVGLIVNPRAGAGGGDGIAAARTVLEALQPERLITGPGSLGEDAARGSLTNTRRLTVVGPRADGAASEEAVADGRLATQQIAREASRLGAEVLVVVGGDGTMADAATALHAAGSRLPILGVGAGSTNAGGLVTLLRTELNQLAGAATKVESVSALELRLPDGDTVLAFNDVVVGDTICGTLDGRFVNLGAEAYMRGETVQRSPEPLLCPGARVTKLRAATREDAHSESAGADVAARARVGGNELLVSAGLAAGSVVVGFTRTGDVMGQALLGGLGLSSVAGVPAACLVSSFPVVYAEMSAPCHAAMEPLESSYVGLAEGEVIRLEGFDDGAVLCADGNPLHALRAHDTAEVRLIVGACRVVRLAGGGS